MTGFSVAFGVVAVLFCSSVGAAPSPLKNSRSGRDGEGGSGGGGGGGGGIFPGMDQWTTFLPGGTLPGGVTMPDFAAAVAAVSGAATFPPGIPTTLPPGFPTGFPTNINDVINSLPGVNP
ncbi:hypothetical protein MTO96_010849 [Rhipicephalus appendiculatus]